MSEDPFRYCVYCGVDCYEDDSEHAADCPLNAGSRSIWVITTRCRLPLDHGDQHENADDFLWATQANDQWPYPRYRESTYGPGCREGDPVPPDQEARAELADGSLIEPGVAWQTITKLRTERDELKGDNADLLNDALQDGQYVKRLREAREQAEAELADLLESFGMRGKLLTSAIKREEAWREEAWQCYVESGADPDGAGARHLNLGEAPREVAELRRSQEEAVDQLTADAVRAMDDQNENHVRAELAEAHARARWDCIQDLEASLATLRAELAEWTSGRREAERAQNIRAERDRLRKQVAEHVSWCVGRAIGAVTEADGIPDGMRSGLYGERDGFAAAADHARQILEEGGE